MTTPRQPKASQTSQTPNEASSIPTASTTRPTPQRSRSARLVGYLCTGMALFFGGLTLLILYTGVQDGPPFPVGLVLFGLGMTVVSLMAAADFLNKWPKRRG